MAASVPSGPTRTPRLFRDFARKFAEISAKDRGYFYVLDDDTGGVTDRDVWYDAQLRLKRVIDGAGSLIASNIDDGKTNFVSGIIFADIEEIVEEPFEKTPRTPGSWWR